MHDRPSFLRGLLGLVAFGALTVAGSAGAAGTASEAVNLEVMIRQLNAVEAVARRSADLPQDPGERYHFDYQRLAGDVARIRQGLQDYLAPSRAQPRDPVELSGRYRQDGER